MDEVSLGVVASGLYVMNWLLAARATDYFAAGLQASPVQHFWTLAVEEQFYLVWPALLLGVAWWCRRANRGLRPVLAATFAAVAISSLAYSVYSTQLQAGAAYFSTLTRGWELALGGMFSQRAGTRAGAPASDGWLSPWRGLGLALSRSRLFDSTTTPSSLGTRHSVPTLGTAAIITAGIGSTMTSAGPARLLTLGPVRHVGRISSIWQLWHWPPLVFASTLWGKLSPLEGMGILAASYVPAVLTNRLVEKPFLHSETLSRYPPKALALAGRAPPPRLPLALWSSLGRRASRRRPRIGSRAPRRCRVTTAGGRRAPKPSTPLRERPRRRRSGHRCTPTAATSILQENGGARVCLRQPLIEYLRGALR